MCGYFGCYLVRLTLVSPVQGRCPSGQRERAVNPSAYAYGGSNPPAPTIYAGVAQLVEHQPSKLRVASSSLVSRSTAHVAQSVERILGKDEVTSSNLVMGSIFNILTNRCESDTKI